MTAMTDPMTGPLGPRCRASTMESTRFSTAITQALLAWNFNPAASVNSMLIG